MKKVIGIALTVFGAIAAVPTHANAEASRAPGLVDRPQNLPQIEPIIERRQDAIVQRPRVDDYSGSNRPLPVVRSVVFNGPTVLGESELSAITQRYLDRPITENDLAQLKNDIANAYADRGYSLVKVATPTQNLSSGELIINIYEGRVGNVLVNTNGVIADYVPHAFGIRLKDNIFDEREAENVVNDLNEIKNINSSITLQPGARPLTTDAVINVQPSPGEDRNYIAADNYGSELTGEWVGSLHLEKSNALGLGEYLFADGRLSNDDLWGVGFGGKIPTGFRNIFFDANYGYSSNAIGDRLAFLDAEGESHVSQFALSGNVFNHDDSKLNLRGGLEVRNHESTLAGAPESEDKVRRVFAEASYLGLAPSAVYQINGRVSKGVNIFGASEEGDALLSRAGADPEAVIFEPSAFARYALTNNDFIKGYARAQYANEVLLSSDLFALGGYSTVRGFEPAASTGERGYAIQLGYDHRFNLGDTAYVDVGPWFDHGRVYNELANATLDNKATSVGIGAEVVANLLPVGETIVRADWAHPLGSYNSNDVEDNSFYIRLEQAFSWGGAPAQ